MNKKNINRYMLLTVFTGLCFLTQAQDADHTDFKELMTSLRKHYESVSKMHIIMQVSVFESATSTAPFFKERVEIRKDRHLYLSQLSSFDMLMNDKYLVVVDKDEHEIVVSRRNIEGEKYYHDPAQFNMDSIFSRTGVPAFLGEDNGVLHYKLSSVHSVVKEVDFYINTTKHQFERIEYYYEDKQVATIVFQRFDTQPEFAPGTFDETNYVTVSGVNLKAAAKYASYLVMPFNDTESAN